MVKLKEIPNEEDRVQLSDLPQVNELIATEEKLVDAIEADSKKGVSAKAGGLVITFKQRDGRTFPQKYNKISGSVLMKKLGELGVKDTEDLQKAWFEYKLTPMRMGYPRYIPTRRVES